MDLEFHHRQPSPARRGEKVNDPSIGPRKRRNLRIHMRGRKRRIKPGNVLEEQAFKPSLGLKPVKFVLRVGAARAPNPSNLAEKIPELIVARFVQPANAALQAEIDARRQLALDASHFQTRDAQRGESSGGVGNDFDSRAEVAQHVVEQAGVALLQQLCLASRRQASLNIAVILQVDPGGRGLGPRAIHRSPRSRRGG